MSTSMNVRRAVLGALVVSFLSVALYAAPKKAGLDWWSLKPVTRPAVPTADVPGWDSNPIDAFVLSALRAAELEPSPQASRATLIRRLYFDLIGLPPSPEEIEKFVQSKDPRAYEALVDELLVSPHYGERWARHWLDVVRFGETHGFEYNQPRNNAWPYKNWVVRALNRDMPYDEFVRLQLAGDVIAPDRGGVVATGFLVAGPHNTTLPSSDKMRRTMFQDEVEDMISAVSQSFLGLTVHCGRCHDHKFDPIPQRDYYRLAAALSGVRHGEREYFSEEHQRARDELKTVVKRSEALREELAKIDAAARAKAQVAANQKNRKEPAPNLKLVRPIASWSFEGSLSDSLGKLDARGEKGAAVQGGELRLSGSGYAVSKPLDRDLRAKTLEAWVRLSTLDQKGGAAISIQTQGGGVFDAIVFGEQENRRWMAGSNGFTRTQSFKAPEEREAKDRPVHIAITYQADGTITGYRDGRPYGRPYKKGLAHFRAGNAEIVFGLRHSPAQNDRLLKGAVLKAQLYDRALTKEEIAASASSGPAGVSEVDILRELSDAEAARRKEVLAQIDSLAARRTNLEKVRGNKTYACVSRNPSKVHVLERGEVTSPGELVTPGGLSALTAVSSDFGLAQNSSDGDRRKKLAEWMTDAKNPLLARVVVNRLWHYHFGTGIVATPNDFGFAGSRPTHPALLDWLASEIVAKRWSLKGMHRLMVTSAAYRQSSRPSESGLKKDAGNGLLWRSSPRRLEAEAIRDSMLAVSGLLVRDIGGAGYRDVRHYGHKGSNFYDPIEQDKPELFRRTLYRFSPRGARRTMLDTFDCPDPSATTPAREVTTTPLQALALLNNSFVLRVAKAFAERIDNDVPEGDVRAKIRRAYQLAYGRNADDDEVKAAAEYSASHGLAALCRILFNTNEFLYVH
ncbi:MAG: DUF1553 domain-containing protein [Planctomycetota bacterium]